MKSSCGAWMEQNLLVFGSAWLFVRHYCRSSKQHDMLIPDGWRLVPIEPTEEMKKAAEGEYSLKLAYKAMLRAAPKPEM